MELNSIEDNVIKGFSQTEWDEIRWNEGGLKWGVMRSNKVK